MDIESNLYRIRSALGGGYEIKHKPSGRISYASNVPGAHSLAVMKEAQFNRTMAELSGHE